MPRLKLYRFVTNEGKAFAFDNVGDFDFWVVVPIVGEDGRESLSSLLCQDIAVIAAVLFGNADIFNGGFHATIVLLFELPRAHICSRPAHPRW